MAVHENDPKVSPESSAAASTGASIRNSPTFGDQPCRRQGPRLSASIPSATSRSRRRATGGPRQVAAQAVARVTRVVPVVGWERMDEVSTKVGNYTLPRGLQGF